LPPPPVATLLIDIESHIGIFTRPPTCAIIIELPCSKGFMGESIFLRQWVSDRSLTLIIWQRRYLCSSMT